MITLSNRILLVSTSSKAIRRRQHTKIFPDDKWLALKGMKLVQGWWGRQMARVDEQCGKLQKPECGVQQDAPFKEKLMVELKSDMLKYRLFCALCYVRKKTQRLAGVGLEKAPPEIDPEEIRLNIDVQTEQKRTAPENEIIQCSQDKESTSSKN